MFKLILTTVLALASAVAMAAVDVNQADQATLETVRGVGPALSGKLMAERYPPVQQPLGSSQKRQGKMGKKHGIKECPQGTRPCSLYRLHHGVQSVAVATGTQGCHHTEEGKR